MTKSFIINGKEVEITETIAIYNGEELATLILHDCSDKYSEGDCITADYAAFPEDNDEAEFIVTNAYWATYWHRDENGLIICDE